MSTYTKIYWLTRMGYLHGFFVAFSACMGLLVAIAFFAKMFEDYTFLKGHHKTLLGIFLPLFIVVSCLIPTTKETIFIIAGGKTIDFISSDTSINKVPQQTTAIISDFLEKQIKSLKKDKDDN